MNFFPIQRLTFTTPVALIAVSRLSILGGLTGLIFSGCYLLWRYFEQTATYYLADATILVLSPANYGLSQKQVIEKAQLTEKRLRIMSKIKERIDQSSLSEEHRNILNAKWHLAQRIFSIIDWWNPPHSYLSTEIKPPSPVDLLIEEKLIRSIITNYKPDRECSFLEKCRDLIQRRKIQRLKQDVRKRIDTLSLPFPMRISRFALRELLE